MLIHYSVTATIQIVENHNINRNYVSSNDRLLDNNITVVQPIGGMMVIISTYNGPHNNNDKWARNSVIDNHHNIIIIIRYWRRTVQKRCTPRTQKSVQFFGKTGEYNKNVKFFFFSGHTDYISNAYRSIMRRHTTGHRNCGFWQIRVITALNTEPRVGKGGVLYVINKTNPIIFHNSSHNYYLTLLSCFT